MGFEHLLKKLEPEPVKKPAPRRQEAGLFDAFDTGPEPGVGSGAECKYELIQTEAQLAAFLSELRKQTRFAFDTETDALGAMNSNLVGMSFSWEKARGFTFRSAGPVDRRTCHAIMRWRR